MADAGKVDPRIAALAEAYRAIARRYEQLCELSAREHELLRERQPMPEVHGLLEEKRRILAQVAADEARVSGEKAWWARARKDLRPADARELNEILDEVARRIERALALEADCRSLLESAAAFRVPAPANRDAARLSAAAAYARTPAGGTR